MGGGKNLGTVSTVLAKTMTCTSKEGKGKLALSTTPPPTECNSWRQTAEEPSHPFELGHALMMSLGDRKISRQTCERGRNPLTEQP